MCVIVCFYPQNMIEKMHEQEFPNRSTLNDVNEIDGNSDEEFRPATDDMFEFKERKHFHLFEYFVFCSSLTHKNVCFPANSLFDDYRLSTINKLPTWAKKQVSSS